MAFALIASLVCGLSDKELRAGFPTNMFLISSAQCFFLTSRRKPAQ
jgi:hypothetical protein